MHYIYHPDHVAKVVESSEYYKLLENGWYDSPAKFPSKTQGLSAKDEEKPEAIGEVKKKGRPKKVQ